MTNKKDKKRKRILSSTYTNVLQVQRIEAE